MAELDGLGLAAVLAADTDFEVAARGAAFVGGHLDERADTFLIENREGILLQNALLQVLGQEFVAVVAGDSEGGLGQVVGTEAEELGVGSDFVGDDAGAGQLDHGAYLVVDRKAFLDEDVVSDGMDDGSLRLELFGAGGERDHDFDVRVAATLLDRGCGFEDGVGLHFGDLGIRDAEAAAAQSEHGVELMQLFDALEDFVELFEFGRAGLGGLEFGDLDEEGFPLGEELVERRIEKADDDRIGAMTLRSPWKSARCMGSR